jgi:type IV pilus assembly protein PilC
VRTADGQKEEGSLTAFDQTEAVRILHGRGYLILKMDSSIVKVSGIFFQNQKVKEVRRKKRTTSEDLFLFFDQFSVLLDASIDIIRSLEIVSLQITSEPLYHAIMAIKMDISGGMGLSQAMAKYPKFFPKHARSIILIGEQSGELPTVIQRVAESIENLDEVRQKIKKAMTYPVLLASFCVVAIAVFLLKIIPTFERIFSDFDLELPALTQFVIHLSNVAQQYFPIFIGVIVVIVIGVRKLLNTPAFRIKFDQHILTIPFLGILLLRSSLASLMASLELMLRNGVTVLEALTLAKDSLCNLYLESLIDRVRDRVKEGSSLSKEMQKYSIFPLMLVQMVGVGEESGRLVDMLGKVSEFYHKQVGDAVDRFATVFEPLILIFVGGIIGGLVIAMFLPIFKMASI